jgi:tRNA(adenine34) deaminase
MRGVSVFMAALYDAGRGRATPGLDQTYPIPQFGGMNDAQMEPMLRALAEAEAAQGRAEVPVGAVLVDAASGQVVAADGNRIVQLNDPTAHAEMLVIRRAGEIKGAPRLTDCDLYVSLEPCPMCAAAISLARIRRLYFGAYDAKGGGVEHGPRIFGQPTCHHAPEVYGGIEEAAAAKLLKDFFSQRR